MSPTPFSLRIFVADGDPDGLRLVERSNWIGKALMFPRALYTKVRGRDEFKQTGVYLLLGPRTDGEGEMLYTVTDIAEDKVVVDGNHPWAGERVVFKATVTAVRAAIPEEISHQHVHGEGGHHH